jgi:hypothetical protein
VRLKTRHEEAVTVPDLAFYNAGCDEPTGRRRLIVPVRRVLRRILRPIFQHQVQLFQALCVRLDAAELADRELRTDLDNLTARHDRIVDQMHATVAFGWDYVAMTRRMATLEDRVEALLAERETRAKAG